MQLQTLYEPFVQIGAIDTNAFIGQWPFRHAVRADRQYYTTMSERLGISQYYISHIAAIFGHDTRSGNEALLAETKDDARLRPFVILNPCEPGWEQEMEWAKASGACGIRLVPGFHDYELTDSRALQLLAVARTYRLPIIVTARIQDERLQHPRYQASPLTPTSIAEFIAAGTNHPLLISGLNYVQCMALRPHFNTGQSTDHVVFDLWFTNSPVGIIEDICNSGYSDKFAYSSCSPIQVAEATALQLATAGITDEQRYALCRGNAERFLP